MSPITSSRWGNERPVESRRVSQGVYRFDPDLYQAIVSTELNGDLPADLLTRLPEWCVYIELQGTPDLHGFFVHLERDVDTLQMELRLLLDLDTGLLPMPLHLGQWDLVAALEEMVRETRKHAVSHALPAPGSAARLRFLSHFQEEVILAGKLPIYFGL